MTALRPMDNQHPMWDRLQRQLARLDVTLEHATAEALMTWVCNAEMSEARQPKDWTIANLDEARQLFAAERRQFRFEMSSTGIRILHDSPLYGDIWIDSELANALTNTAQSSRS